MDEKYFYEHLHEIMFELERNSVILVPKRVKEMMEAGKKIRKMFPNAEVMVPDEGQIFTRDEEIRVDAKELVITDPEAFLEAVDKADYIEFDTMGSDGIRLAIGFKKVMITQEEFENEEF